MNRPRIFSPLLHAATLAGLATLCVGTASAWEPKQAAVMTKFAKDVDPEHVLPEYPRPQLVRDAWLNLNGVWEYQPGKESDPTPAGRKLASEILVPFPVEAALSGVMEHHDRLWYRRTFNVPAAWKGQRVLLHFGAVDWESEVFVNGKSLGVHQGGYDPFSFDVTDALKPGESQELIVRVFDPTDDAGEPRGKQSVHPGGIMYTPCTGIWQTVWLEPVPEASIVDLKLVPDVDGGKLRLTAITNTRPGGGDSLVDSQVNVVVKDGGQVVAKFSGEPDTELSIPVDHAKLWSPESPFLYDLEVTLKKKDAVTDSVKSYFGMRKIELGEVDGVKKMLLNGKFVFEFGPLDQGFWPDGIYTQPTEAALKYDIQMMKDYGFNMVRKHIKVEPARWYYWTDKLGLLVWQDMPSANSYIDTGKYKVPPIDKTAFKRELRRMIETHWNTPSLIMWDTFNEAQSQHDTVQLVGMVKQLDPSRLVNEASGNDHFGAGDVDDIHHYPPPACPKPNDWQAIACGEYGGIGLDVPGHMWSESKNGYRDVKTPNDLLDLYAQFAYMLRDFRDKQGMSAAVYTQLTDVETEVNGLMTYDRLPKVDPAKVALANRFQYPVATYEAAVPTSERTAQTWLYTTEQPAGGWEQPGYAASNWLTGKAGFGHGDEFHHRHTDWNTGDIWLRRHFNPGALTQGQIEHLVARDLHDEDVEIYINGVEAVKSGGYNTAYEYQGISPAAKAALKPNADNVLAVHCHQTTGGQYIDVGLSVKSEPHVP